MEQSSKPPTYRNHEATAADFAACDDATLSSLLTQAHEDLHSHLLALVEVYSTLQDFEASGHWQSRIDDYQAEYDQARSAARDTVLALLVEFRNDAAERHDELQEATADLAKNGPGSNRPYMIVPSVAPDGAAPERCDTTNLGEDQRPAYLAKRRTHPYHHVDAGFYDGCDIFVLGGISKDARNYLLGELNALRNEAVGRNDHAAEAEWTAEIAALQIEHKRVPSLSRDELVKQVVTWVNRRADLQRMRSQVGRDGS